MSGHNTFQEKDVRQYQQAWTHTMVRIWHDRLSMLTTERTGRLRRSITARHTTATGLTATWQFRFLRYGIYLDHGRIGRDGNSTRRPWFTPSWNISRRVLAKAMTRFIGEAYHGAIAHIQ